MNKQRRSVICAVRCFLSQARELLEIARNEEQEAFDALPENFQATARGEAMEGAISCLDDAVASIEEIEMSTEELTPDV